ncbi:hypothetical protein Ancab_033520 [Ancistrocladus abbreviatus]
MQAGHGPITKLPGRRNQVTQFTNSKHPQGSWNLPPGVPESSGKHPPVTGIERNAHLAFTATGDKMPSHVDHLPDADSKLWRLSNVASRATSSGFDSLNAEPLPVVLPASTSSGPSANLYKSQLPPYPPTYPPPNQISSQFDFRNTNNRVMNHVLQQFNADEIKNPISAKPKLPQMPSPQAGAIPLHHPTQPPVSLHQPMLPLVESQQSSVSPNFALLPPRTTMLPTRGSIGFENKPSTHCSF